VTLQPAPARQRSLREHNLALVLQQLASDGPASRAQLAAVTGLTKATVSSLIDDLVEARLVVELGPEARGQVGRPGSALALNRRGLAGVGLEVNVDYLAVCVTDLAGEIRYRRTRAGDNRHQSPGRVLARAARMARAALAAAEEQGLAAAGLAVALPGLVETGLGLLRTAPNLGWRDVAVGEFFTGRFHLPVAVDNEANLAALGELWFGGHDGPAGTSLTGGRQGGLQDFVHVSGEIGVGGGIVIGRELFRGVRGFAGEIGHLTVQPDGPPCRCGGRGCLEQLAGQEAILRAAGLTGEAGSTMGDPGGSVATLVARARAGDPRTLQAIEAAGHALGIAIAAIANLFDPGTVVLGGLYAALEPWLRAPLTEELAARTLAQPWSPLRILASRLGPDAAVRGAAGTVIRRVLSNPAAVLRALAGQEP
jgi:predicted NBD/HSP70 family sugar kinase